jgi:hypothetical protein
VFGACAVGGVGVVDCEITITTAKGPQYRWLPPDHHADQPPHPTSAVGLITLYRQVSTLHELRGGRGRNGGLSG